MQGGVVVGGRPVEAGVYVDITEGFKMRQLVTKEGFVELTFGSRGMFSGGHDFVLSFTAEAFQELRERWPELLRAVDEKAARVAAGEVGDDED